jgi:hypothetical protein
LISITHQPTLRRVAFCSLGLSIILVVLAAVANRIGTPAEPCAENLPAGVPHLWGSSITAIVVAWLAVIGGVGSMVSAAVGLFTRLRYPDIELPWKPSVWALFLVCTVVVLIADITALTGFYSYAIGRIADCV